MTYRILLSLLILCPLLVSCTYRHGAYHPKSFLQSVELAPQVSLQRMRHFTVRPEEIVCHGNVVGEEDLQLTLSKYFQIALNKRFAQVNSLNPTMAVGRSLSKARDSNCSLLIYPAVVSKENNIWSVAEWDDFEHTYKDLGMDSLILQITLWDVNSKQLLDMGLITSRSSWLDIHENNSLDLIAHSLNAYVNELVVLR